MKEFIKEVRPHAKLYRDTNTGIAWIADGNSGLIYSIHANISSTGSVRGMKQIGRWGKKDKTVRTNGYIYNIDTFICNENNELEKILADECMCVRCIERRK